MTNEKLNQANELVQRITGYQILIECIKDNQLVVRTSVSLYPNQFSTNNHGNLDLSHTIAKLTGLDKMDILAALLDCKAKLEKQLESL